MNQHIRNHVTTEPHALRASTRLSVVPQDEVVATPVAMVGAKATPSDKLFEALVAARALQPVWAAYPVEECLDLLRKAARHAMGEHKIDLHLIEQETGEVAADALASL
jgi:delta 1-pyrroline-5-carboxylate dehydrogenase